MDIKIYEDQTGKMFYPEKRTDEDRDIVRLFDNKTDMFIKKINGIIEISCYALIQKSLEREIGCYIIYKGTRHHQTFTEFKNEATKSLISQGFKISNDISENAVFNNIEKFDISSRLYNTNTITNALNSGERLYYYGGNLSEIGGFCKEMLDTLPSIKIAISPKETRLGEINILRSASHDEHLTPSDMTKQVLNRQQDKIAQKVIDDRRKIEDTRKNEIKESVKPQLDEGINSIERAVNTLKTSGFTRIELIPFFNIYTTKINKIFGYSEYSNIDTEDIPSITKERAKEEIEKEIDIYKDEETDKGISKTHIALIGIALGILGLIATTLIFPNLIPTEIQKIHPLPTPEPTPIPTINITPTPTPTPPESYRAYVNNLNNVSTNGTNETSKSNSTALIATTPTAASIPKHTPTSIPTPSPASNTSGDDNG